MNDSDNKTTKVVIWLVIAVLIVLVAVYAYNLLKDDNSMNDVKDDMNQVGQDVVEGTEDLIYGAGEVAGDVANGVGNAINSVIDFTMTDNAMVENNVKTNTSEKISANKEYQGLVFKEVRLVGRDNTTTFTAKIKNESTTDFITKNVTITFYGNENTTITTRSLSIPDIKAGETTEVTVTMEEDVANAYDYTIE